MERALEGDRHRPFGRLLGEFDGILDRFGTRVDEQHVIEISGHDLEDLVGGIDDRVVEEHVGLRMDELVHLRLGRGDDLGMGMAGADDGDAGGHVQPLVAVIGPEP